jgi:hypothetical protein
VQQAPVEVLVVVVDAHVRVASQNLVQVDLGLCRLRQR